MTIHFCRYGMYLAMYSSLLYFYIFNIVFFMKFYFFLFLLVNVFLGKAQEIDNLISATNMQAKNYSTVLFKTMKPNANGESEMQQIGEYHLREGKFVAEMSVATTPDMKKILQIVSERVGMNPENLLCPICHQDVGYAEQRMNKDSSVVVYSHEVMNSQACSGHKYEIRYTFLAKQLVKKIMVKSYFTGLKPEYCGQAAYDFFKKVKDGESYVMEYWNGENAPLICEEVNFEYQKLRFFYHENGNYDKAQIINNEQITNLSKNTDVSDYNDLAYQWQYDEDGLLVAIQAKADEDNLNTLYLIEYE